MTKIKNEEEKKSMFKTGFQNYLATLAFFHNFRHDSPVKDQVVIFGKVILTIQPIVKEFALLWILFLKYLIWRLVKNTKYVQVF